jgi:hypothetical protein
MTRQAYDSVAAFRLHQRRERRGIVEHQLAHQLVGALMLAENNRRSRRTSSSAMVSALIMPRSALNKMRKIRICGVGAPLRFRTIGLAFH